MPYPVVSHHISSSRVRRRAKAATALAGGFAFLFSVASPTLVLAGEGADAWSARAVSEASMNETGPTLSAEPTGHPREFRFSGDGGDAAWFGGVRLETGDGTSLRVCNPGQGCRAFELSHRYSKSGDFDAVLKGIGEGDGDVLARITVTIGN